MFFNERPFVNARYCRLSSENSVINTICLSLSVSFSIAITLDSTAALVRRKRMEILQNNSALRLHYQGLQCIGNENIIVLAYFSLFAFRGVLIVCTSS